MVKPRSISLITNTSGVAAQLRVVVDVVVVVVDVMIKVTLLVQVRRCSCTQVVAVRM